MAAEKMPRLQHWAYRAANVRGLSGGDVVVVCIEVDSRWRDLVDHLMPGKEPLWQEQRDLGVKPVALGTVMWRITEWLVEQFPDITDVIMEVPPEGKYKGVILNHGGCTIIEIEPKLDPASSN